MARTFAEIEAEIQQLTSEEKALLARHLIEELDAGGNSDVDSLWLEEAQRRYQAYRSGQAQTRSSESVFANARQRLKNAD